MPADIDDNPTDISTWPTRAEAAEQLGVSVTTLDRYIADEKLETALEPRAGKRPAVRVNPADVARLKPAMPSTPAFLVPAESPIARESLDVLKALGRAFTPQPPRDPQIFLRLAEAAELTGLSRHYLMLRIKDGTLPAIRDQQRWKIRRQDLARL